MFSNKKLKKLRLTFYIGSDDHYVKYKPHFKTQKLNFRNQNFLYSTVLNQ